MCVRLITIVSADARNPTFVMTQSRLLEKKGFVQRTAVSDASEPVSLSLTDKAYRHLRN
jgi:hypothetical protein